MKLKAAPIALLIALILPALARQASAAPLPSVRLKPILEPCLNAILAPLENNPQMPRVKVETLRADFAASAVTASTPAEKQVYQNAMAVCDAMTSDMDARANAQEQAKSSAQMSTLSTAGDIDESMPMHGRNPGPEGQAIRQKQKDDRADADARAQRESSFVNSSAYTSWVKNAPNLREYVMNLYTRQTELEALYIKSAPPSARAAATKPSGPADDDKVAADKGSSEGKPVVGVGKWTSGKKYLELSADHSVVRGLENGTTWNGTWTIDGQGNFSATFPNGKMGGLVSKDGKSITMHNKAVYTIGD